MAIKSWAKSRSSLAAFGCPFRWKKIHLEGVDDESDEARRGSAFHAAAGSYIGALARRRLPASTELAAEAFSEGVIATRTPAYLLPEVDRLYFDWAEDFELNLNAFVSFEERITYRSEDPALDAISSQQDLVYAWADGVLEIFDWKTYFAGFTERQAREDFQARQYAWQAWRRFPGFKRYRITFVFVRLGWSVSVDFEPKELERVELHLQTLARSIEAAVAADEFPAKAGDHCGFCRLECPLVDDARRMPARITSMEQAERVLAESVILERALSVRRQALASFAALSGPISIPGVTAAHSSRARSSFPVDRVIDILRAEGVQPKLTVGKSKLSSFLKTKKHAHIGAQLAPLAVEWNETRFGFQRTKAEAPELEEGSDADE